MPRLRPYLMRMCAFLGIVMCIGVMLAPSVAEAFAANMMLNGMILGVMVFGVFYIFRQVLRLQPELAWLHQYHEYGAVKAVADGQGQKKGTVLLLPLVRVLSEHSGKLKMSALSMRSLLDGIAARLDESREISRYLIGLLIFLGLLGTFWGLLGTVAAVADVIGTLALPDGGDVTMMFASLQSGLQKPLAGMGTAFSSSLFGLAGSLILGFLELQAAQAQNRFYNALEDCLAETTNISTGGGVTVAGGDGSIPGYLQALMEQTAENLDSLGRIVRSSEDNKRQLQNCLMDLTEKLSSLSDRAQGEQELLRQLIRGQAELKPIMAKLADGVGRADFGMDEATRQHIRNLDVYLSQLLEDVASGRSEAIRDIRGDLKLLTRTIASAAEGTPMPQIQREAS